MQHEDDKRRYHGGEFQFIGFDELTEFSESQYLYVFSRMRSARDPDLPNRIRATTNPGGIGHVWVKERFVDICKPSTVFVDPRTGLSRRFIPGRVQDNLALMENDPGYISRLKALPEIDRKRYLEGDWEIFSGQVFPELSSRVHGCESFEIPPEWERFLVIDWGFSNPFCVLWFAIDYDNCLYVYREWYGSKTGGEGSGLRMVSVEVAQGILEREEPGEKVKIRLGDPSMFNRVEQKRRNELVGTDFAADFRSQGVYLMKADNDRIQGLGQVHKRFALDLDIDESTGEVLNERPQCQIFNTCEHFWRTVPAIYTHKTNPEDVDTKQEDHSYDAFRYGCMFRPLRPKRAVRGVPPGSFQAERAKLLRARKYARSHGISIDVAYTKIR